MEQADLLELVRAQGAVIAALASKVDALAAAIAAGTAAGVAAAPSSSREIEDERHREQIAEQLRLRAEWLAQMPLEKKRRYYPDLFPPVRAVS